MAAALLLGSDLEMGGSQRKSVRIARSFDGRYAAMLLDEGYRVDCSVTPGVDWRASLGDPDGNGGSDYTDFPDRPYLLNPSDISVPASGTLLEVPMTTCSSGLHRRAPWTYRVPLLRQAAHRLSPKLGWLCPTPLLERNNLNAMLQVARAARAEGMAHLEFMAHSSELMPGGSPTFKDALAIERLYEHLEMLFAELSSWCRGVTLKEFHARFRNGVSLNDPH